MNQSESIFSKTINPIYQAAIALAGVVVISLLAKLVGLIGITDVPQRFPWMSAASFMLFIRPFQQRIFRQLGEFDEILGALYLLLLGLGAAAAGVAYLLSSLTMSEAGSYRWIYIVVGIGYLVFLSLMAMLRKIVEFAQREEWNHPRIRRK